jgi:hypothetical protein
VPRQVPRIPDLRLERRLGLRGRALACLLDMEREHVDELDLVAGSRKPRGVDTGTAADVEHARGRLRQHLREQLECAHELEVVSALDQPVPFDPARVVTEECVIHRHSSERRSAFSRR